MIINKRFEFDQKIKQEYQTILVSGSDEVGRGAMAGPIVVASVILEKDYDNPEIKDSKLISEKKREQLFEEIIKHSLCYDIKVYDAKLVDQLNPKATSILGIKESIQGLSIKPELCLIDGEKIHLDDYQTLQIIKGDNKSQSIAAASILAKVFRDRIMIAFDEKYLGYNFAKHKGYCTKDHIKRVEEHGILEIHRQSYKPIANIKEK